jgi:8-oxo-dGTP diphosphatase
MENVVRVGVAVHVHKDGNLLLMKRIGELGNGKWCSPGGKMDIGETPEECGLRELSEEIGDNLVVTKPWYYGITNDCFIKENKHYITIHMISEYISGEAENKEPNKCSEIGWFDIDKINKKDLFLPMLNYIADNIVE